MRRLYGLALIIAIPGCAGDPGADLSGSWLGAAFAGDSTWSALVVDLTDQGTTLEGSFQSGAGGEIVVDTELAGEQDGALVTIAAVGGDAREPEADVVYAMRFEGVVHDREIAGTFTATRSEGGEEAADLLEGQEGTFLLGIPE
jgi:hypothetical protein